MKLQLSYSRNMSALIGTALVGAIVLPLTLFSATPAKAALHAKYTFNDGTANDSSGNNRHGTVVDPQSATSYAGGALDLRSNNGFSSNQDFSDPSAQGAYVDLPNGIISGASAAGDQFDLSVEVWFTEQTHRHWARIFDFGTSEGGEDISDGDGGSASSVQYLLASSGSNGGTPSDFFVVETHLGTAGEQFPNDGTDLNHAPLPVGQKHHLAVTFAQAGTTGGTGDNGTATAYVNGVNVGSAPIVDGLFIDLMTNDNNWLGRSQWPDELFDGTYDEFRIHDVALSDTDVLNSFNAGPDEVPFPSVVVNRATGEVTIENSTSGPISLTSYSILSADGAIDIASWDSIQPANGWTRTSETATDASESGGIAQAIAAGNSISLGNLWSQTSTEDILFNFATTGASGSGEVTYVGDVIERSDLNGDGSIDAADWSIFIANNAQPLGTALPVVARLKGDLDDDLDNDYDDFKIFKSDFIAANSVEEFAALSIVPEPSALLLFSVAGAFVTLRRKRA